MHLKIIIIKNVEMIVTCSNKEWPKERRKYSVKLKKEMFYELNMLLADDNVKSEYATKR